MRHIVLDTETTGLEWKKGNRVVEIGCVELVERRPTGRTFHKYLNPDREFEAGAQEVTGLTLEFLADKPRFSDVADEFLEFVDGAELVIHNAAFDMGFLEYELSRLGEGYRPLRERVTVLDTLELAGSAFPASAIRSTHCASAWAWTTRIGNCTGRCWTRSCWPKPGWR